MEIELTQVDQFATALDAFEGAYTAMHAGSMEAASATFLALRELQATWVAEAQEAAAVRVDRFAEENEADSDELPDELKAVLNDKDGLLTSIDNAREARIGFLDATEDALGKAMAAKFNEAVREKRAGEHRRNRERVSEISHLVLAINKEAIGKLDSTASMSDPDESR